MGTRHQDQSKLLHKFCHLILHSELSGLEAIYRLKKLKEKTPDVFASWSYHWNKCLKGPKVFFLDFWLWDGCAHLEVAKAQRSIWRHFSRKQQRLHWRHYPCLKKGQRECHVNISDTRTYRKISGHRGNATACFVLTDVSLTINLFAFVCPLNVGAEPLLLWSNKTQLYLIPAFIIVIEIQRLWGW